MALYSSTIYLSGLNVRFVKNSAHETGGTIHIEPDMTHNPCPGCFYQVQDHPTDATFYYSIKIMLTLEETIFTAHH